MGKLFKFFGQISKAKDINRGGMGLGLTISKMILQQLNGEITVDSEYHKGSTFTFRIPIEDEQFEHIEPQFRADILSNNSMGSSEEDLMVDMLDS